MQQCVHSLVNFTEEVEYDQKFETNYEYKHNSWVYGPSYTTRNSRLVRPVRGYVNKLYCNSVARSNDFVGSWVTGLLSMMVNDPGKDLVYDLNHIELFSCYLNREDVNVLCKLIRGAFRPNKRMCVINVLKVMGCELSSPLFKALCDAVSSPESRVTTFAYCYDQSCYVPGLNSVVGELVGLITNNKLNVLVINNIALTKEEVAIIFKATCSEKSRVTDLTMCANGIDDNSLHFVVEALTSPTNKLVRLDISDNYFTNSDLCSAQKWDEDHKGLVPKQEYPPDMIKNMMMHRNYKLDDFEW